MINSWGGGVNYQMQIVTTKLPNENIQTYQLQMIDSGGRGKLPIVIPSTTNTISHVLLKNEEYPNGKYPNLPTTNDQFWGGGWR